MLDSKWVSKHLIVNSRFGFYSFPKLSQIRDSSSPTLFLNRAFSLNTKNTTYVNIFSINYYYKSQLVLIQGFTFLMGVLFRLH